MIGVAISLYDKFDDLAILTEILRENFEQEFFISVCSNHPEAEEKIEDLNLDIDHLADSSEIDYTPDMEGDERQINLHSRIMDSFRKACIPAMENSDYFVHLHADAWMLDEDKLKEIINSLEDSENKVAARGIGPSIRNPSYLLGHVMDQFIFFESDYAKKKDFFDFNPLDLMPRAGVHTSLMILLMGKIGLSKIWFYSDMMEDIWWDDTEKSNFADPIPSTYSPKWKLLHIGEDEFPEDYGKNLQAIYLDEHDIDYGEKILQFKEKYLRDKDEVLKGIKEIEKSQDRKLKMLGFNPEEFARNFNKKKEVLDKNKLEKLSILGKNIFKKIYYGGHRLLFSVIPFSDERFEGKSRREMSLYRDSPWPQETEEEIYSDSINTKNYPENIGMWFKED